MAGKRREIIKLKFLTRCYIGRDIHKAHARFELPMSKCFQFYLVFVSACFACLSLVSVCLSVCQIKKIPSKICFRQDCLLVGGDCMVTGSGTIGLSCKLALCQWALWLLPFCHYLNVCVSNSVCTRSSLQDDCFWCGLSWGCTQASVYVSLV